MTSPLQSQKKKRAVDDDDAMKERLKVMKMSTVRLFIFFGLLLLFRNLFGSKRSSEQGRSNRKQYVSILFMYHFNMG